MANTISDGTSDGLNLPTFGDILSIFFRRLKVIVFGFIVVFLFTFYFLMSQPRFSAEMSVLVSKKRVDPVVTSNTTTSDLGDRAGLTEEDLNTEAELLKSPDLLLSVVQDLHLGDSVHSSILHRDNSAEARVQRAVNSLASNLQVKLIPKTYILSISYRNPSQGRATEILQKLGEKYKDKNIALSDPKREQTFFEQRANEYKQKMQAAGQAAADFATTNHIVDADAQAAMAVHRADEFHASAISAGVSIAETEHQIDALEKVKAVTPQRITTGQKNSDNPELLQMMKTSLLNLQTKEAEMAVKFQPTYPPLVEVRQQIKMTQAALSDQASQKVSEETTDRNPLYDWVVNQLAQAKASLAAVRARQRYDTQAFNTYQANANTLMQKSMEQHNLNSDAKAETDNYLVYARREEEARISDALDSQGILNVIIASPAKASVIPILPRSRILIIATILGAFIGFSLGFVSEYFDDKIRTPEQLEAEMGARVLAAIPATS